MLDANGFVLFLAAALLLAVTPGPGIFYVTARTLAGGRGEGLASSFGTAIGGCIHVLGGAAGISALVVASAEAFALLKTVGAAYLVWLGCKTIWEARSEWRIDVASTGAHRAFRDGVVVEALKSENRGVFPGVHPAVCRSLAARGNAVRPARPDLRCPEHGRRYRRGSWSGKSPLPLQTSELDQTASAIFRRRPVRPGRIVAVGASFDLMRGSGHPPPEAFLLRSPVATRRRGLYISSRV